MNRSQVPDRPDSDLATFHRLGIAATVSTFVLIVIGGIVRESGSGLGCGPSGSGLHGWPLCNGRVLPIATTETIIEYSHRAAAAIVTIVSVLLLWWAWRRLREQTFFVRSATAVVLLIVFQAVLGGLTVEHNLNEVLVAVHLGTAMLLLGLLITMTVRSNVSVPERTAAISKPLRSLMPVAALLSFAAIVSGGYMAGTEAEGRASTTTHAHHEGAHMACGRQFPLCNNQVMPFGSNRLVNIHLVHRTFIYLATLSILILLLLAARARVRIRGLYLLALLLITQVTLGALSVLLEEGGALIVLHLTVATLLWSTLVMLTARVTYPSPDSSNKLKSIGLPNRSEALC